MAEEAFEDYGSGGDSPFGPSTFRRSINRKSGRFGRRSMRRAERPEIKINTSDMNNNSQSNQNGNDLMANEAIVHVESDIDELSDQMNEMTRRMLRIEEERQAKSEHTEQVKIENTELRMRVNELEAQLHDLTLKYDETKQRERQRAKEQIEKIDREKKLQLEVATNQLKQTQEELTRHEKDNEKLRQKTDKYKKQIEQYNDKLEDSQNRIVEQIEKYQALNEKTSAEREQLGQQLNESTQIRGELQIHVNQLEQQYKELAAKYKEMKKSASDAMQLVKKQETTGNSEISDLREENEKLTQQIEDLNLQLLQQHIAKSKDFQKNPEEESLASEIGMLEVDEITMKYATLKIERQQLQEYLDTLLANILERDPSLLEKRPTGLV